MFESFLVLSRYSNPLSQSKHLFVDPDLIDALVVQFETEELFCGNPIPLTLTSSIPRGSQCALFVRPTERNFTCIRRFSNSNNVLNIFFVPAITASAKHFIQSLTDLTFRCASFNWSYSALDYDMICFNQPHAFHDIVMVLFYTSLFTFNPSLYHLISIA